MLKKKAVCRMMACPNEIVCWDYSMINAESAAVNDRRLPCLQPVYMRTMPVK
ncbi:MAG TPA: hypothetical protein VK645_20360 [Chitinophagaceae bacterium]|nr:hypothetical protein [Chitinophagaceae bacterium]